jgi:hypothetical protein
MIFLFLIITQILVWTCHKCTTIMYCTWLFFLFLFGRSFDSRKMFFLPYFYVQNYHPKRSKTIVNWQFVVVVLTSCYHLKFFVSLIHTLVFFVFLLVNKRTLLNTKEKENNHWAKIRDQNPGAGGTTHHSPNNPTSRSLERPKTFLTINFYSRWHVVTPHSLSNSDSKNPSIFGLLLMQA